MTKLLIIFLSVFVSLNANAIWPFSSEDSLADAYKKVCLKSNQPISGYGSQWADQISKQIDTIDSEKMSLNQLYQKFVVPTYNSTDCQTFRTNRESANAAGMESREGLDYFSRAPDFGHTNACKQAEELWFCINRIRSRVEDRAGKEPGFVLTATFNETAGGQVPSASAKFLTTEQCCSDSNCRSSYGKCMGRGSFIKASPSGQH